MEYDNRQAITKYLIDLARGERSAIDPAFKLLWPIVRAFCTRYLNHCAEAEDVAQNAIIKIFARVNTFDSKRDGLTWALTIAMWECRTELQMQRRRVANTERIGAPVNVRLSPEEEAILRESLEILNEQINQLYSDGKEALFTSLRESSALDARTRKRKQRALAQLRRWWEILHGRA